jgi:hypothetical protein
MSHPVCRLLAGQDLLLALPLVAFLANARIRRRGTPGVALDFDWKLSKPGPFRPHQTLGKPLDLDVNLELEQLVKSTSLVSFSELMNEIFNLRQARRPFSDEIIKNSDQTLK